jgi:hypothetical protein
MTPTLLIFLLSLSCVVQGQKDTVKPVKHMPDSIYYFDRSSNASLIAKVGDTIFVLRGDSLSAIKLLWKELELSRKREKELQNMLDRIRGRIDTFYINNSDRLHKMTEKALKKN